ncbi:Aste57867_24539 [Aphanomyces stellatus]|uniref:Aste57867_24539 protein n=1 Tax=Aphanomyces stellatus TaxID=120398 RepID=A0A485LQQ7_9STRA|nr:hypothetical protein As57867_024462 [Aphanomyces stellatus]VFU01178.1 Aste57867_24539 [Aphanomyces stellatus]
MAEIEVAAAAPAGDAAPTVEIAASGEGHDEHEEGGDDHVDAIAHEALLTKWAGEAKKKELKSLPTQWAQLDKVQKRYQNKEKVLLKDLETTYDFMARNLDPIISELLEELMLHRPEQVSAFLAVYILGPVDATRFKKTQLQPQAYFDRKVHPALSLAMDSVVRDKPQDVKAYLTDFFEQRANVY